MIVIFTRRIEIESYDLLRNIAFESFSMSVPSRFLINSFGSFLLITFKSSATDFKCFWPFNSKKLPSVKPKLKLAIGVD